MAIVSQIYKSVESATQLQQYTFKDENAPEIWSDIYKEICDTYNDTKH